MDKSLTNAVKGWIDWHCRIGGNLLDIRHDVIEHIVDDIKLALAESIKPDDDGWFPIESLPQGKHVMLWWEHGERGNGGVECAIVFWHNGWDEDWSYWTHGGPNSGWDWGPANNEKPKKWKPYSAPKTQSAR